MEAARRPYRMKARAESAAATADRIVAAASERFAATPYDDVALEEVAEAAGVSLRTVLRRFGSKEGLFVACAERMRDEVAAQRGAAPVGDVPGAIRNLLDHYEQMGDRVLLLLAQEHRVPRVAQGVRTGRSMHRAWVERVFGPAISRSRGARRERLVMALVAATDVYTWKVLRRDWRLSREETERTMEQLVRPLVEER